MPFLDPLRVELVKDGRGLGGSLWRLTAPLRYESERRGLTFNIPEGFLTDFASVPRVPIAYWIDGGIAESCATLHDFCYSTGCVPRAIADRVLEEAMKERGFGWVRRWTIWAGVRAFGGPHYQPHPLKVEIKPAQEEAPPA
jgi:hypothetical protein